MLGNERLAFLPLFLPFNYGIPSHQTLGRVFSILKPQSFEKIFMAWSANLNGSNCSRQIALDGKALRGSFDTASAKKAMYILNACSVDNGITLAQLEVDVKTNRKKTSLKRLSMLKLTIPWLSRGIIKI